MSIVYAFPGAGKTHYGRSLVQRGYDVYDTDRLKGMSQPSIAKIVTQWLSQHRNGIVFTNLIGAEFWDRVTQPKVAVFPPPSRLEFIASERRLPVDTVSDWYRSATAFASERGWTTIHLDSNHLSDVWTPSEVAHV